MKNQRYLKPLLFTVPLVFFSFSLPAGLEAQGVCSMPNENPFKVTISVVKDDQGNPVISFTNYTLDVSKGAVNGKAKSKFILVCLEGQASFPASGSKLFWKKNPGDFSEHPSSNGAKVYIIKNTNKNGGTFKYSVNIETADFGEMVIDPRVRNTGGGTT